MPLPVQLEVVAEEMQLSSEDLQVYINRKTGELALLRSEVQSAVEDDDPPGEGWELDEWRDGKRVLEDESFIELPNQRDIHEYRIMESFCATRDDERLRNLLLDAISARGAFRRFKDLVRRQGIEKHWYAYRNDALKRIAADFLDEHGIPYVDEPRGTQVL